MNFFVFYDNEWTAADQYESLEEAPEMVAVLWAARDYKNWAYIEGVGRMYLSLVTDRMIVKLVGPRPNLESEK